jgi:hypothetical protein
MVTVGVTVGADVRVTVDVTVEVTVAVVVTAGSLGAVVTVVVTAGAAPAGVVPDTLPGEVTPTVAAGEPPKGSRLPGAPAGPAPDLGAPVGVTDGRTVGDGDVDARGRRSTEALSAGTSCGVFTSAHPRPARTTVAAATRASTAGRRSRRDVAGGAGGGAAVPPGERARPGAGSCVPCRGSS